MSVLQQLEAAYQRGDRAEVERLCRLILQSTPGDFDALNLLGIITAQSRRAPEAVELLSRAVRAEPGRADAHSNLGNVLLGLGRLEEALQSYDRALKIEPAYAEALNNRGAALSGLKRYADALASYDRALRIQPRHARALNNRGNVLLELQRPEEALQSYDQALRIDPGNVEALYNRGNALSNLKRHAEALESYDRALSIQPGHAVALYNRGNALRALRRPEEALASYDAALKINPGYADALNNRGIVLRELNRLEKALESYDQALAIKPDYADALVNRGHALSDLKGPEMALESYHQGLKVDPTNAQALMNQGAALCGLGRYDEALQTYDQLLGLRPDYDFLQGTRLHAKMRLCDWRDLQNDVARLVDRIARDEKASPPFNVITLSSSLALQRKAAAVWSRDQHSRHDAVPRPPVRSGDDRIRIGYFSADYHNHPIAYLIAELFEKHDRSRFEIVAFSFGAEVNDEMRKRLAAAFDRFIDVRYKSDQEVAQLARVLGIDIAVDLMGYTDHNRAGIFAWRAAPVQVSYLGYPGTMAADFIDYLIADATVIPDAHRAHYAEKIASLPDCFQVNDSRRRISDRVFSREELELPGAGFVYCCFNDSYKITPEVFDRWMRVLGSVEGSVLWLQDRGPRAVGNLRNEAVHRGISAERLVFAKRMPLHDHLARLRLADLFLDTLPYNAGATASDALWVGLPVLTCAGESFAGRMAASLLQASGLAELIASTPESYEQIAIALATDGRRLSAIKRRLGEIRLTSPLFDIQRFTRNIEAAYAEMHRRFRAGLPPDHIAVTEAGAGR